MGVGLAAASIEEGPLVGGRPEQAVQLDMAHELKALIHTVVRVRSGLSERVWLDLANDENLIVVFEIAKDDNAHTCTMSVKQTRVMEECELDTPGACHDAGCVAVRWNVDSREGCLVDLFKAKKGERAGCDISSAKDPNVRWGKIMMQVIDDIALLLDMRHVYLADESSVRLSVWNDARQAPEPTQVMLKYLRPLVRGVGYYEPSGYYTIDKTCYYGRRDADALSEAAIRKAREHAAHDVDAFNRLRSEPFSGGGFARALARVERGTEAPPIESTLTYCLALALAAAQGTSTTSGRGGGSSSRFEPEVRLEAFRAAARSMAKAGPALPHQFWAHARAPVPYAARLDEFIDRHATVIDAELLEAPHFGALIQMLLERSRLPPSLARNAGSSADAEAGPSKAAALMLALMFDFFAIWSPRRVQPLKRKDYDADARSTSSVRLVDAAQPTNAAPAATSNRPLHAPITVGCVELSMQPARTPIIQRAWRLPL